MQHIVLQLRGLSLLESNQKTVTENLCPGRVALCAQRVDGL